MSFREARKKLLLMQCEAEMVAFDEDQSYIAELQEHVLNEKRSATKKLIEKDNELRKLKKVYDAKLLEKDRAIRQLDRTACGYLEELISMNKANLFREELGFKNMIEKFDKYDNRYVVYQEECLAEMKKKFSGDEMQLVEQYVQKRDFEIEASFKRRMEESKLTNKLPEDILILIENKLPIEVIELNTQAESPPIEEDNFHAFDISPTPQSLKDVLSSPSLNDSLRQNSQSKRETVVINPVVNHSINKKQKTALGFASLVKQEPQSKQVLMNYNLMQVNNQPQNDYSKLVNKSPKLTTTIEKVNKQMELNKTGTNKTSLIVPKSNEVAKIETLKKTSPIAQSSDVKSSKLFKIPEFKDKAKTSVKPSLIHLKPATPNKQPMKTSLSKFPTIISNGLKALSNTNKNKANNNNNKPPNDIFNPHSSFNINSTLTQEGDFNFDLRGVSSSKAAIIEQKNVNSQEKENGDGGKIGTGEDMFGGNNDNNEFNIDDFKDSNYDMDFNFNFDGSSTSKAIASTTTPKKNQFVGQDEENVNSDDMFNPGNIASAQNNQFDIEVAENSNDDNFEFNFETGMDNDCEGSFNFNFN